MAEFFVMHTSVDVEAIARDVNDNVGREVETAETVKRWLMDNNPPPGNGASPLAALVQDAIVGELGEAYD